MDLKVFKIRSLNFEELMIIAGSPERIQVQKLQKARLTEVQNQRDNDLLVVQETLMVVSCHFFFQTRQEIYRYLLSKPLGCKQKFLQFIFCFTTD